MGESRVTVDRIQVVGKQTDETRVAAHYFEVLETFPMATLQATASLIANATVPVRGYLAVTTLLSAVDAYYITTDLFTEAGDTALSAHVDNEANAWGVTGYDFLIVSGTNDDVESS